MSDLPSEWTEWASFHTWAEGTSIPSDWTGWNTFTTWQAADYTPSQWTGWSAFVTSATAAWRRDPATGTWRPLGQAARRNPVTGEWEKLQLGAGIPQPAFEGVFFGMLNSPQTEAHWIATEASWGGIRAGIRRSYSADMLSGVDARIQEDIIAGRASWHSFKGDWQQVAAGVYDAAIINHLNAIPADHDYLLTFAHEPENDNPLAEEALWASRWRAAQAHVYDLVKAIRPQTWVGPILMGYTFSPSSGRQWSRWVPPVGKMDFFGLDPYNPYRFPAAGNGTMWRDWPLDGANYLIYQGVCDSRGVPGAIAETASNEHETQGPMKKANWIRAGAQWAIDHHYLAFCYFNSYKPGDTAEGMLLNSSPQSLAAWAEVLAANQRGVKP